MKLPLKQMECNKKIILDADGRYIAEVESERDAQSMVLILNTLIYDEEVHLRVISHINVFINQHVTGAKMEPNYECMII